MAENPVSNSADTVGDGETKTICIYIADDHALVRQGLRMLLEKQDDMEVVGESGDGEDTIEGVNRTCPDVLLLDISMPKLGGLEVCEKLSQEGKRPAVLFVTMYNDRNMIARAFRNGATGYLVKESVSQELVRAVRMTAAGKLYLSPEIGPAFLQSLAEPGQPNPRNDLSVRERQILQMLSEGSTMREIAKQLCLSVKTVETYRLRIMNKLDIHNVAELVKYALRMGITTLH